MSASEVATCFIDSNIWLYAFIESQDANKSRLASELVQTEQPALSTQVVNEVCVNLLRKADFSEEEIQELVAAFFKRYPVMPLNRDVLVRASQLRTPYALSFWDSIVVSSAMQGGMPILYSEDMQDGLVVEEQLEIVNPFK